MHVVVFDNTCQAWRLHKNFDFTFGVEYGNFQCIHCGRAYPVIKEIQRLLDDDLHFVFVDRKVVRVRVPPSAPIISITYSESAVDDGPAQRS